MESTPFRLAGRLWVSGRKNHRPLTHNLYDDEGISCSTGIAVFGGLIQTAVGT
jgi:hypothetical protein